MIDLTKLPPVSFIDTDPERVRQSYIKLFEAMTERTLAPGNPERLFVETLAAREVQLRELIQQAGLQTLVRDASDAALEGMGALTDVQRLDAGTAIVSVRFSMPTSQAFVVPIPARTRVTADGGVLFETINYAQISIGQKQVDLPCRCTQAGSVGNGYVPGQIAKLVDPLPWVTAVVNVTESAGGTDEEKDDHLRERVVLSPESMSTAGPDGAYEFWAKSASADIIDVSVRSPTPGVVEVRPLLTNGAIPGQEILDAVAATLTDKKRRPLTDHVQVLAPEAVGYELALTYWISSELAVTADTVQAAVQAAIDEYVSWQCARLSRDINPSKLVSLVMAAGAQRCEVASPLHTQLAAWQVASLDERNVIYGGEDE